MTVKTNSGYNNYYFRKNIFGDILAVYNSSKTVLATYTYDAFGNATVKVHPINDRYAQLNPFRYRGYYWDDELELYYVQKRYYDPEIGRFISPDSVENINPSEIFGLNLYAYCYNNPIKYVDPTGKFPFTIIIACAIAAVVGGAYGALGTFIGDAISSLIDGEWHTSSWEIYVGNTLGNAIGGVVSLFNPAVGVGISGPLSTLFSNVLGWITGSNENSIGEFMIELGLSTAISITMIGLPQSLGVPGITKGSGTFQQFFRYGFNKAVLYGFEISGKSLLKEIPYLLVSNVSVGFFVGNISQGFYSSMMKKSIEFMKRFVWM